jgi:hypothetical protein
MTAQYKPEGATEIIRHHIDHTPELRKMCEWCDSRYAVGASPFCSVTCQQEARIHVPAETPPAAEPPAVTGFAELAQQVFPNSHAMTREERREFERGFWKDAPAVPPTDGTTAPRYSTEACPEHGDACPGASCCCADKHPASDREREFTARQNDPWGWDDVQTEEAVSFAVMFRDQRDAERAHRAQAETLLRRVLEFEALIAGIRATLGGGA